MTTIWILEKYITNEMMKKQIRDLETLKTDAVIMNKTEAVKTIDVMLQAAKENLEKMPEGHWTGWVGKSNYKTFCLQAQESLRLDPKARYRVLKANMIDTNNKYWCNNYENGIENVGVLKYLYATM